MGLSNVTKADTSINILDTITKVVPWCSVYQASLDEPNITSLAWILPKLDYLRKLLILETTYIACSAAQFYDK